MNDLKFRYTFKRKSDGHIYQLIVPLGIFEDGHGEIFSMLKNELWELVGRDRFIGLQDKNGREIYEHDIVGHEKTGAGNPGNVITFDSGCFWWFGSQVGPGRPHDAVVFGDIYSTPELVK